MNPLASQLGGFVYMLLPRNLIKDISTVEELAPFLGVEYEELVEVYKTRKSLIHFHKFPKPNGGIREIVMISDDSYKNILNVLNQNLSYWYSLNKPQSVHGFVKKYSIITNAAEHVENKIVVNVDIKDFFKSISKKQVKELFDSLNFQSKISKFLSELTTVEDVLPTGFSTSPVISNYVCISMDLVFERLCKAKVINYTRYADDMTFSSNVVLPSKNVIAEVLNRCGFKLNESKFHIYRKGGPQYVTGLTVVDKRPRLAKRFKKQLRLEAYYIKKFGFENHFINRSRKEIIYGRHPSLGPITQKMLQGYRNLRAFICYVHSVEPKLAKYLMPLLPDQDKL